MSGGDAAMLLEIRLSHDLPDIGGMLILSSRASACSCAAALANPVKKSNFYRHGLCCVRERAFQTHFCRPPAVGLCLGPLGGNGVRAQRSGYC